MVKDVKPVVKPRKTKPAAVGGRGKQREDKRKK